MTNPAEPIANKVPKGRSPSYPGIPLGTAVERARIIYGKYKQFRQPLATFTAAWGYKTPTTGPASVTFAALKKYGLVEDEGRGGERTAILTPLAVDIIMKPDATAEIQEAALLPPIHREMWDRFKADPPDADALRYEFVAQRGFTETGLRDFLREYGETITYAKLGSSATITGEGQSPDPVSSIDKLLGRVGVPPMPTPASAAPPKSGVEEPRSFEMSLRGGGKAVVATTRPLTADEWERLATILKEMKESFVEEG